MNIALAYGARIEEAVVDWGHCLGSLDVAECPPIEDIEEAAEQAFSCPIGSESLKSLVRPGERVALVVSDSFRKTQIHEVLPILLNHLRAAGIRDEHICFIYATGTHRGPTPEEQRAILGQEVYARYHEQAFTHDPHDKLQLSYLGDTSRGTPVWLNRRALEADRLIVTGTVVLHYFGGFGGGRKAVLPGIAGVDTIAANHSLNLHPVDDTLNPDVRIATLEGNPVAEDMMEGTRLCKVDFLVNTVLNRQGKIAGLFAGDLEAAHRAACQFAKDLYAIPIHEQADLVIASAGNAANFIQSHKCLFNAYQAVRPGGRIVLLTASPEGYGGNRFEEWLRLGSRARIIAELRKSAEINGQTALSTAEKAPITLFVTELSEAQVHLMGGRRAPSLQHALDQARMELDSDGCVDPSYYLMPSAAYTVPVPAAE
jgi:nickel-dependent lactate racemase